MRCITGEVTHRLPKAQAVAFECSLMYVLYNNHKDGFFGIHHNKMYFCKVTLNNHDDSDIRYVVKSQSEILNIFKNSFWVYEIKCGCLIPWTINASTMFSIRSFKVRKKRHIFFPTKYDSAKHIYMHLLVTALHWG